jgi:hypothetical protein
MLQVKTGQKKRLVFTNAFVGGDTTKGSFPTRPLMPPKPPNVSEE